MRLYTHTQGSKEDRGGGGALLLDTLRALHAEQCSTDDIVVHDAAGMTIGRRLLYVIPYTHTVYM